MFGEDVLGALLSKPPSPKTPRQNHLLLAVDAPASLSENTHAIPYVYPRPSMQKITTELNLTAGGILELIALKMLSVRTHSVEELLKALSTIGYETTTGSIYPLLSKFRKAGYVISGYEEGDDQPVIRTYDLTKKGRRRLSALQDDWRRLYSVIVGIGRKPPPRHHLS